MADLTTKKPDKLAMSMTDEGIGKTITAFDPMICGICRERLPARPSGSQLCATCGAPTPNCEQPNCSCGSAPTEAGACAECGVPVGSAGVYWPRQQEFALPEFRDFFPESDSEEGGGK